MWDNAVGGRCGFGRGAAPGNRKHINRSGGLVNIPTMRLQGGATGLRYVTWCGTQSVNSRWVSSQGSYLSFLSENQTISSAPQEIFYPPPHPSPPPKTWGWGSRLPVFFLNSFPVEREKLRQPEEAS